MAGGFKKFIDKLEKDIKEKQVYSNDIVLVPAVKVSKFIKIRVQRKSKFVDTSSLKELIISSIDNLYKRKSLNRGLIREEIYTTVLSNTNEVYNMDIIEPSVNYYPGVGEYFVVDNVEVEVE